MEPNTGIKGWQWVVTVIVIIILIVLGYYMFRGDGSVSTNTPVDTTTSTDKTGNEVNRVTVSDQYPGNIVYISSAQFSAPGWVVVHKDNNGKLGDAIGSAYFAKGINPGKVNLTENTKEGMLYYAVLHTDDGDKKFDAKKDMELKDSKGNTIMKLFRATSSVTEIKG